ncbi:MAG: alpha-amylase family glycosyl hydrolase [Verrucomicrobiota bacterium]|nr:alpha-amylase family glycosyl hydrolase [Verrucomicrobiota bacterium]
MGAIPYRGGVTFRVWAPNATSVNVAGSFNDWSVLANPLTREDVNSGLWSVDVAGAVVGQPYKFVINGALWKQDPRARKVGADGNGIIYDTNAFDWSGDLLFARPSIDDLVAYEMHIGTFNAPNGIPATFDDAIGKLDHLSALGVSLLNVMPVNSFAPSPRSWGYDPRGSFAIEETYGGPDAFKRFVKAAHARGMAVHLDIVHNHYGSQGDPGDLWNFDGWSGGENGGGIYFYQTPGLSGTGYGPRPNYTRDGVVNFITDDIKMWFDEYHLDGFRWDDAPDIESYTDSSGGFHWNSDGIRLLQNLNHLIHASYPGRLSVDEAAYDPEYLGFDSSWDTDYPIDLARPLVTTSDADRDLFAVRDLLQRSASKWSRIIYTDSHDTSGDLNHGQRLPTRISPSSPTDYWARKRSMLGAAIAFTSPSIPMLLQGTEMLETRLFSSDTALDWNNTSAHATTLAFYRDLIKLRRNLTGKTAGLRGTNQRVTTFVNDAANKVLAYHRWNRSGANDDTLVVINLQNTTPTLPIVFPREGLWNLVMSTDSTAYGADFSDVGTPSVNIPIVNATADITIGPYSALIYSRAAFADADNDGMPDAWETQNGLNPNDPGDAALDPDGDGISNLQEYINNGDPHVNLAASLDLRAAMTASTGGNAKWFDEKTVTHDGVIAAQSGSITDSQVSYFELPITGPDTISFWWKVSSEQSYDYLTLSLDGTIVTRISGEVDWSQLQTQVPPGTHTLRFSYAKDYSVSMGSDAGWVDQLITNFPRINRIVAPSGSPVAIVWAGKACRSYTVQFSDQLTTWQDLSLATYSASTDTTFTAFDSTSPRPNRRFYRVVMAP